MRKLLVPFDGSACALRALQYAITMVKEGFAGDLELLHVGDPVPLGVHGMMTHDQIQQREADEAGRVLKPARDVLDQAGISYQCRLRIGTAATEIVRHAQECACAGIVMGSRGMGPVAGLMVGSVATRVISSAEVPVTVVK
ncbi:MAG TPA: universal stress protein [Noviherbaspirillum sp.]|jgi:nucleotide-binding universal stress UspA family protein|uniref:universal stress protein n=1 Tax=Noviherbaspirillum sp. TaxID=1926288 RepID=UPI002F9318A7